MKKHPITLRSYACSLISDLLDSNMLTLWVHLLGDLQSVRVGQVSVGWGDGQDQTALLGDKLQQHVPNLVLDVWRLVSHGHFSHPRQVDQGQVQH